MASLMPLKQSSLGSCVHVKLPPVRWMQFTMPESQLLGKDDGPKYWDTWRYTWAAILLASGIPHHCNNGTARFLLSKYDDYALAVLLRTTITTESIAKGDAVSCITGKPIFSWVSDYYADTDAAIEIVYPSQLSKEEAAKLSVRGKPLEFIEYEVVTETED